MDKQNKIVDFVVDWDDTWHDKHAIFAILEKEVKGKKKYGRKFLSTNRVKVRGKLTDLEAERAQIFYKMATMLWSDVDRVKRAISKEDVEISEDVGEPYIEARLEHLSW